MDANVEQPPQTCKKKNSTSPPPPPPPPTSFSSLPDDLLLKCFARISKSQYRSLSLVSKSIHSLINSKELYQSRSWIGIGEPCLYLCQRLPSYDRWFHLDRTLITDGWIKDELSLSMITPSSSAPSMPTTVTVGFEIYQMGGTINEERNPSSAVRVLDCRTHTWRDAPNMTVARQRAEAAFIDGKIYVIGGIVETSSVNWAEVYDLKTQTWKPLPSPCDDAKVRLYRGELIVNSKTNRYEFDSKEGRWKELTKVSLGGPRHTSGPWCFIESIKFGVLSGKFQWYDSQQKIWLMVEGLENLYNKKVICKSSTIRLANHDGKLVIVWDEPRSLDFPLAGKRRKYQCENKRIWCTVIRLEKRTSVAGFEIRGEIERCNAVLTVPSSYEFLSCTTL